MTFHLLLAHQELRASHSQSWCPISCASTMRDLVQLSLFSSVCSPWVALCVSTKWGSITSLGTDAAAESLRRSLSP
eukprot:3055036-Pyramimonas_sp.AAC.1